MTHIRHVLLSLILLLCSCTAAELKPQPAAPDTPTLKVMTYNLNFGIAGDPSTMDVIEKESPDVVMLQETTPAWEAALRTRFKTAYPYQGFKHCCGAGGLAILSKYPIHPKEYTPAPSPGWFPAWRVVVETPLGKVQTLNLHLRPPMSDSGSWVVGYFSTPEVRLKEIQTFTKLLEDDLPTLVAGDFNEGSSGKAISFLQAHHKLKTVLPQFHPGEDTWRWNTSFGQVGTQLDHITYNPNQFKPLNAYVLDQGRSDHLPLVTIFTHKRAK